MNNRAKATTYLAADIGGIALSWILITALPGSLPATFTVNSDTTLFHFILFLFIWILHCSLAGLYSNPYRKSRLLELFRSGIVTFIFLLVITLLNSFFGLYAGDYSAGRALTIFTLLFLPTYLPRVIISSITNLRIRRGTIGFNTLILGNGKRAEGILERILNEPRRSGYRFTGYVRVSDKVAKGLSSKLNEAGTVDDLGKVIKEKKIEEVIIALEPDEKRLYARLIGDLSLHNVVIKTLPSDEDSIITRLRNSEIFGTPLVVIPNSPLSSWESNIKLLIDILFSTLLLILLTPLIIILSLLIFLSDGGPVLYRQERVGRYGKSFRLLKFRSMIRNAETDQPMLSRLGDPRVTRVGRFMRKHRFDEIPNLINVIKGEMSLIGPRPERRYFVNQIVERAPQYKRLLSLKPGVTSWGQVKYGYASSVEEMTERMEYDLLYLENISILLDMKIAIYTSIIIILGKGV